MFSSLGIGTTRTRIPSAAGKAQAEYCQADSGDLWSPANSRRLERQAVGIGDIQLQIPRTSYWMGVKTRLLFQGNLGIKPSN